MIIEDYQQKIEYLKTIGNSEMFESIDVLTRKKHRSQRTKFNGEDRIFVYKPRSRYFGRRYSVEDFAVRYNIRENPDETIAWHKRLKRAINCLENSGLWQEIKEQFENMLKMTWEDRKQMNEIYWKQYDIPYEQIVQMFEPYVKKYPFAFFKDEDGKLKLNTTYTWEKSACRLKSMYFGKYENKQIKEEISEAIKNNRDYSTGRIPVNYDVSFEYRAKDAKAWYSEEYRDCGNGHYYIALNHSTALFLEDD